MTARFHSKCPCANEIPRGARMFYAPRTKTALCEKPCGQKASAEFAAAAQDEAFNNGQPW